MRNDPIRSRLHPLTILTAVLVFSAPGVSAAAGTMPGLNMILIGDRPPELLEYASDATMRESLAVAWSSYQGSLRVTPCSDSGAFWACRDLFDSGGVVDGANRVEAVTSNASMVSAERSATAFDYTTTTPEYIYSYFADITPATSQAMAKTDFGSNKGAAAAWNGRTWTETRVQSAWDPTESSIIGVTHAGAVAMSTYTEVLIPDADGQITLEFELSQHAGSAMPGFSGPVAGFSYDGYGIGSLLVQVFDLDRTTQYGIFDSDLGIEGYVMVGDGDVARDWTEPAGSSFLSVAFDVTAGTRYSLVSQLRVEADENASANFYGTASLERILVTPGMALAVGSGTAYAVAAIPEPSKYALTLAGLTLLVMVTRLRRIQGPRREPNVPA
ncbi:MAG: hypothetical protein RBS46_15815 [Methyloversatilis sp.]|jgi:hypothetical protein|nr:hypothetical protein [Methyloversatilis sp.]